MNVQHMCGAIYNRLGPVDQSVGPCERQGIGREKSRENVMPRSSTLVSYATVFYAREKTRYYGGRVRLPNISRAGRDGTCGPMPPAPPAAPSGQCPEGIITLSLELSNNVRTCAPRHEEEPYQTSSAPCRQCNFTLLSRAHRTSPPPPL